MRIHTVRLACDGCGAERQGRIGDTVADLRQLLDQVGWASTGDRDVCPPCLGRGVRCP